MSGSVFSVQCQLVVSFLLYDPIIMLSLIKIPPKSCLQKIYFPTAGIGLIVVGILHIYLIRIDAIKNFANVAKTGESGGCKNLIFGV